MKNVKSYSERNKDLFDKIESRRMDGKHNNRYSKMNSKKRYWVVVFSNAQNYKFKKGQIKWYLKFWIWDSHESVILGEHILKSKNVFDDDGLWTEIHNIIYFNNSDGNFIIFSGNSRDVLVYDVCGEMRNTFTLNTVPDRLYINKLSKDSTSNEIIIIAETKEYIRSARVYYSIVNSNYVEIKLKGTFDEYERDAEFFRVDANQSSAYIVKTVYGTNWKVAVYYYVFRMHIDSNYGDKYDLYRIASENREIIIKTEDPEDGTLDLTISSGKNIIRTKMFVYK